MRLWSIDEEGEKPGDSAPDLPRFLAAGFLSFDGDELCWNTNPNLYHSLVLPPLES